MAAAYRVAAPSIRFVPWAALASCWPLPQQLLPVSATGGGRRCCTLRIFSGKIILNFGFLKSLRTFQKPFFHGRGRKGKRQLPHLLPAEAAARRESLLLAELPQSKPDGFASSLGEGASGAPVNFAFELETVPLCQRPHLRGGWHRVAMTGGVFSQTLFLHKVPTFRPNH